MQYIYIVDTMNAATKLIVYTSTMNRGENMEKANKDIREKMHEKGVYMWQIADILGKSEGWVCRLFRKEIDGAGREMILDAISRANVKYNNV